MAIYIKHDMNLAYPHNMFYVIKQKFGLDMPECNDDQLLDWYKQMPPREARNLIHYYRDGITLKQLSILDGVNYQAIQSHIGRSLKRLAHIANGLDASWQTKERRSPEKRIAIEDSYAIAGIIDDKLIDRFPKMSDELRHNLVKFKVNTVGELFEFKKFTIEYFSRPELKEVMVMKKKLLNSQLGLDIY